MLEKLSRYVSDQRKRRQLNQALSQVDKYLKTLERRRVDFERLCTDLRGQRRKVTDEELLKAREKFADVWAYLGSDQMFAINPQLNQLFDEEKDAIIELDGYSDALARFTSLQKSFHPAMLDVVRDETNQTIAEHEQTTVNFSNQLRGLKEKYIAETDVRRLQHDYEHVYEFFKGAHAIEQEVRDFLTAYEGLASNVRPWNEQFIARGLGQHQSFLDDIDGKALDAQQRLAVLTDQDNLLVLAGAGSGKTLTIAGKVKFLVEVQNVNPMDILLISFTRDAAREMGHRINNRLGVDVDVFTFHKLGLSIISGTEHRKPDIANEMESFLKEYMKNTVYGDKKQLQKLLEFFSCYVNIPKDISLFDSLGDHYEHCKNIDFETVKGKVSQATFSRIQSEQLGQSLKTVAGESVKSLEEVMLANFLFLQGVAYEYEHPYEHDTRDEGHVQYRPDFYLPEYGIYIEHFGVNEYMKAPWLSAIEEAKYIESMEWKRTLHKEHKTTLIESFSYHNKQGLLLDKLEQNLLKHGVQFREVDYKEIFDAVFDQTNNNYLAEFMKLIGTFIGLFKSNGHGEEEFDKLQELNRRSKQDRFLKKRAELFLDLTRPIYAEYQASLKEQQAIDFNDMINQATELIQAGRVQLGYKYIIIDEYQDISQSRFRLVKAIKDQTSAKVMCVGDDWQSIFRFAGSDLELFTQFGEFFGTYELLRIEKTYRNSQQLIDVAGKFVMQNPRQYRKNLRSDKRLSTPVRVIGYQQNIIDAAEAVIQEIVAEFGEETEIMLIGRNNFDIRVLERSAKFSQQYNRVTGRYEISYQPYPNLTMFFLTAHRSKGREADHVILLNAANSQLGFPNRIADDPVLLWVLTNGDEFEFSEERRLFYVALTRTRNRAYILAPDRRMSLFVKELIDKQGVPYQLAPNVEAIEENPACPKCRTGKLVVRTNRNSRFLGCTNFPMCEQTLKDVGILLDPIHCSQCGGYMVKRKGKFGSFYSCHNYPRCEYKYNEAKG